MDIRKRIYKFPKMGVKARMIAITTTSGTGSEVTPFAVVTDDATGQKYPLADYALTPDMAIVDANLVMDMPRSLCAFGGLDAVTHALEAYVSVLANEYSDGQALQALKLLKENLPASYAEGAKNPVARERVHNAATIAGIAFANAFLGVCHSMAHKLGSEFHIPHGLANALLISNVIRYNANDNPTKQTAFSQYDRPQARRRYAEIADHLGLSAPGDRTAQKIEKLLAWLDEIKTELGIPTSIREAGVQEADFLAKVDKLADDAFDDQCTGANPRYPLIAELKQIMLDTFYGREFTEPFSNIAQAVAEQPVKGIKADKKAKKV
jgi:acetaldehyde dehydrogenase/alcohol dehydrogenase